MNPTVTVVISPRERFSFARASLEAVYHHAHYPFDLVYVDGNSPAPVRAYLERAAAVKGFRLIQTGRFLSPNEARNIGATGLSSQYVAFLDNDVDVSPGWLARLVDCAETTGAWAVAPVYFEGVSRDRIIHMAGGDAEFGEHDGVRTFHEEHLLNNVPFDGVAPTVQRVPTGFFEFHGVLVRRDAIERFWPLDEGYLSMHEHMDVSLRIRRAGGAIVLEPGAQVTYTFGLLDRYDIEYARLRWSDDWNRRSTLHFARTWGIEEQSAWVASSITWGNGHLEHLERMQRGPVSVLKAAAKTVLPRRVWSALRELRG